MSKDFPYSLKNGISLRKAVGVLGCSDEGPGPVWLHMTVARGEVYFCLAWFAHLLCFAPDLIIVFYNFIPSRKSRLWISDCLNFYWQIMLLLVKLWASWTLLSLCNEANILLLAWCFKFNVMKNKGSFLHAFLLPLPLPFPLPLSFSFLLFFFPSLFFLILVLFPSFLPFLFCFFPKQRSKFPEFSCSAGDFASLKWERLIPDPCRAVVW